MGAIFCSAGRLCGPAWWLPLECHESQFTQKQADASFLTLRADPGQHVFRKVGRGGQEQDGGRWKWRGNHSQWLNTFTLNKNCIQCCSVVVVIYCFVCFVFNRLPIHDFFFSNDFFMRLTQKQLQRTCTHFWQVFWHFFCLNKCCKHYFNFSRDLFT